MYHMGYQYSKKLWIKLSDIVVIIVPDDGLAEFGARVAILLTWINLNIGMEKWLHPL